MSWKDDKMAEEIDEFVGTGGHPAFVLISLQEAMYETAEHLRADWGDTAMAKTWEKAAARLDREIGIFGELLKKVGYLKP